jgi:hypothetical protein
MHVTRFTTDFAAAKEKVKAIPADHYINITDSIGDKKYNVARWSQFSKKYDSENIDEYLKIPMKTFTTKLPLILNHTIFTGIGKIVTFRDDPRYVLEPGGNWRSYLADVFGVTRKAYSRAVQGSLLVSRLIEAEVAEALAEASAKVRKAEVAQAEVERAMKEMEFEWGLVAQEISHLRSEARRHPPD